MEFKLNGPYIKLDQLLKATGVCYTGGEAKALILEGNIYVNGEAEMRRGRKIKAGDRVTGSNNSFIISVL